MKATRRIDGEWVVEEPDNLSKWLWKWDGTEAVAIDGNTYYCALEETAAKFRDAWAKERRKNDKRRAAMFTELDRSSFANEPPADHTTGAAWCAEVSKLCSERATCGGVMAGDCR